MTDDCITAHGMLPCCQSIQAFPSTENEELLHHRSPSTALVSKHQELSFVPKYQISLIGALSRWTTMPISNPVTPSAQGTAHSLSTLLQKPDFHPDPRQPDATCNTAFYW